MAGLVRIEMNGSENLGDGAPKVEDVLSQIRDVLEILKGVESADASGLAHRMRHEAAHASVPVEERMDVVEAVMGAGNGHDFARGASRQAPISPREMLHECRQAVRGRGQVPSDRDLLPVGPERSRNDLLAPAIFSMKRNSSGMASLKRRYWSRMKSDEVASGRSPEACFSSVHA